VISSVVDLSFQTSPLLPTGEPLEK